ncbi:DEAD/DEAH box helicase [Candidatus Woesearchaeota archaeon]|nr:DEAD/DEAH box helicase [Candidatus Woesearchaeota archaeon]MCF7900892.1 DEAD/DEAH box helicase [Candidatus Woesearchaeota archaeon]MCF8013059.1 DEAD/DEAH box helicase [Candidatus Woesearchaeota archaeon]
MTLKTEKISEITKFKEFKLDRFQIEAIQSIEKNNSVVVSAATGTGKTLIADYIIDKCLKEKQKVIYTAPIKALSNQKYRDFKKQYGEENVGILTGDITINPEAPIKIMTTEIYRNMLLANDPETEELPYVIFDEIHFLGDIERGTVWEESIIFSHENTRFLCLSATIPNARQFANWIQHIKKHNVDVVTEKKRAVPLKHMFFDDEKGFATLQDIEEWKKLDKYPKYNKAFNNKKRYLDDLRKRKKKGYLELLHDLEKDNQLPCIYFCFSRQLTQKKAELLKTKKNYLNAQETSKVGQIIRDTMNTADEAVKRLETTKILRECLKNGIGFHHAGILPTLKELVEELFAQGLIKVLFATETFAVGINMPAKTVCFDSLEKFDGIQFRYLNSKEYFQLAGRAGRRGIDKEGFAISVIDRQFMDIKKVANITESDSEPLLSQFRLSFNTVLNMVHSHSEEEIAIILQSSLFSYQETGRQSSQRVVNSFNKKKKKLYQLGYIIKGLNGDELSEKGLFAMRIYTMELLTTEIFCSSLTPNLTNIEILLIVGRIMYEERKNIKFKGRDKSVSNRIYKKMLNYNYPLQFFRENPLFTLEPFLKEWFEGCKFEELMNLTTMPEGDIVRFIRQILDMLQQIQHATLNKELKDKVVEIQKTIDRDVIAIRF